MIDTAKTGDLQKNQLIEQRINAMSANRTTKSKIIALFNAVGFEQVFGRADISKIIGITASPAGELIKKLKAADLIMPVTGQGKGKYKFLEQ